MITPSNLSARETPSYVKCYGDKKTRNTTQYKISKHGLGLQMDLLCVVEPLQAVTSSHLHLSRLTSSRMSLAVEVCPVITSRIPSVAEACTCCSRRSDSKSPVPSTRTNPETSSEKRSTLGNDILHANWLG